MILGAFVPFGTLVFMGGALDFFPLGALDFFPLGTLGVFDFGALVFKNGPLDIMPIPCKIRLRIFNSLGFLSLGAAPLLETLAPCRRD